MNAEQQKAVLTISLLAAFADGANDEHEREHDSGQLPSR